MLIWAMSAGKTSDERCQFDYPRLITRSISEAATADLQYCISLLSSLRHTRYNTRHIWTEIYSRWTKCWSCHDQFTAILMLYHRYSWCTDPTLQTFTVWLEPLASVELFHIQTVAQMVMTVIRKLRHTHLSCYRLWSCQSRFSGCIKAWM